jgi:hypothetical protein
MLTTRWAVRATKNHSRATPFVWFFSATFWPAAMLTHCLMGGPKRHIPPERYTPFFAQIGRRSRHPWRLNFSFFMKKHIDIFEFLF